MDSSIVVGITFCNHLQKSKTKRLEWSVLAHPAALLWLKLLKNYLQSNKNIHTRFNGFANGYRDEDFLASKLNKCIEIINNWHLYEETIPSLGPEGFGQEYSNTIHHHFELLMGPVENLSNYYKKADNLTRRAICGLNHYIHDLETFHRAQELCLIDKNSTSAGVVTEFRSPIKYELADSFFKYFTTDLGFGDICLHYSQIGKTWLEVFVDKDEEIFKEAILPHKYITGEFDIFFGESTYSDCERDELREFLKKHGQDINDQSLALGYMPVAKMKDTGKTSNFDFVNEMSNYMSIANIEILINGKSIVRKEVNSNDDIYLDQYI